MSPAKKQKSSSLTTGVRGAMAWLLGTGRPIFFAVAAVGILGGGAYVAWLKLKPRILDLPEYRLIAECVEITPLPDWIHSDIREEAFRDPSLADSLRITDDGAAERVAKAFAHHPWVAKVVRVDLPRRSVELIYRKPVCMVQVSGGLLPVDAEGTLLPSGDFSPTEATRYPRLEGVDQSPTVSVGARWTDTRVISGSEIAAVLLPAWAELGLHHIMPLASPDNSGHRPTEPTFALVTRVGSRIVWGYAPGANAPAEPPAAEKLARLLRYVTDHDTLDGRQGQAQELDVRTMRD